MEASSTYLKTSFLRFTLSCLAVIVVLLSPLGEVMGQEREYADNVSFSSPNVPANALELLGSPSNYSKRTVEDPGNSVLEDESYARLVASPGLLAGLGAFTGVIELQFPSNLPADTWSYVRIQGDQSLFNALLGGSLGDLLGNVLGVVLIGNQEIAIDALDGTTPILSRNSTQGFNTDRVRLLVDKDGNYYIAIRPNDSYDRLRITNRSGSVAGLGTQYNLDIFNAFSYSDSENCLQGQFTSFDGEGLSLNLLQSGAGVTNLGNAIDDDVDSYSQISAGTISLGLGSAIYQTIYYDDLSDPEGYLKIKLGIANGAAVNAQLIGNIEIKAYAGTQEVFAKRLSGGLINGVDVLGLLQDGQPATVYLGPGVAFDRITIGYNALVDLNLGNAPIHLYDVKRYGPDCPDPDPIPLPDPTTPMLSNSDCDATLIDFAYANFPFNAVDENNDTYTTLEASSGVAAGIGDYEGFIELGFNARAAGTTTYIRIDFEDEVLGGLLDGNVGELAGDLVSNVLFGEHYFTVEAKNEGSAVLTRSSNVGFSGAATGAVGTGDVKIVQDKNGHYYVAVTPEAAYNSLRITEELGALLGLGEIRNMNVYHMCMSTGSEDCEQAFATYSERGGLTLDLLNSGNFGVSNAHLAIDDDDLSVEDDDTYSEIGLGTAAIGASVFQSVQFHTPSSPADYFKVKFGVADGSVLNVDLLNNIEIRAYNGDELVYAQRIQNGIVANVDILGLLSTNGVVTLPIGPGKAFDRVAIGISSIAGLDAFSAPLRVYSIKRFGADCPDPNPLPEPPETEPPFNAPDCGVELGEFEHVNFAYNAIDGNHETYATISSGSGVILGAGGFDGFIDLRYDTPIAAQELSYIRIDMADEGLLNALVGGSLGEFVADVGDLLLFGNHYFDISVRNPSGGEIYNASGADGFGNNNVRIVQDKVGRYYIAFTAADPYQSVRITLKNTAAVGADAVTTMNVYDMCRETEFDPCEQATFTSYDGTGLSLNLFEGANPAGVINPQYAIDDNNSNYAELTLGTAGVGATIYQDIYYKTKSSANVRLRLQSPSTLLNVDLLGAYKVYLFNGDQQVLEGTLQQDGLINGLDLLGLLNSGGIVGIEFAPGVEYDRVRIELGSAVGLGIGSPIRLYGVYRISDECPDPEYAEPPFEDCADVVISGEEVDDIQNLIDGNHNSYATVRSDAGLVLGINAYSGHVELGYQAEKDAGTTSYIRISYDEGILDALAGGTLGDFLGDLIEAGVLGHHYFNVIVKNGDGTEVLTRSSLNGFLDDDLNIDPQVRIVQDGIGRYYLAVTPTVAYQSIRLEDHITSAVGVLASEGHLNVYGMCNTPIDDIECAVPFTTSFDGTGLSVDVLGTGGAGVDNAFWAIDDNTSNFSTLSLGNLSAAGSIQQNIQFNKATEPNATIRVRLAVGDGSGLSANVFSTLQVVGYLDNEEVFVEDFDQAFVGVNLADLLNNGNPADLTMIAENPVDEIAIRLSSLLGIGVAPNVRLYEVSPDCNLPQFVAWKSYEIDGDPALTSVKGGETVEYTIHVRNTGNVDIEDFVITDAIPEHTVFGESTAGTLDGDILTFTGIDVPVGETATVSFTVAVDDNLTGVSAITNVALVKANADDPGTETFPPSETDPNEPDDSGDTGTTIPVEQINSLVSWKAYTITDGASTTSVSGGETVEYSIYVRNLGNQDLTNVVVSDVLPEGVTYVSGGDESSNIVTFEIASLAVGQTSDALTFTVTVKDDLTDIDVIRNVATVTSNEITTPEESFPPVDNENPTDPDDSGDTGTDIPVDHVPSVISWKAYEVDGDASVAAVSGGETVEYTIYVRNTGNVDLTNLTVSDVLPAGVTWMSGGTHASGTVTFTIPSLAVGATSSGQTFTVEVAKDLTGIDEIRNVAVVSSDDITDTESFPPADNANPDGGPDDSGDTGTVIDVTPVHDVTIALTGLTSGGSNGPAVTGEVITYTITVENTGNKELTGVGLSALVPEHTAFEGSDDGGTVSGNTVNFPAFDLGVGETRTFTYEVEVGPIDPTVVESIDNTATINYRNEDDTADETETAEHSMQTDCIQVEADDIELQASALEVCEGTEVTLNATATGITGADFLWFTNPGMTGTPVATGAEVTVTPGSPETTYYVMVVADGYCFQTPPAEITITANPLPPVPTIIVTGDATVCEGESVELTATAGAESYVWYVDGTSIPGQTSNVLLVEEPGVYTVLAVDGDCASGISAGVTVEVLPLPAQPTITYDGALEICEGSAIILTSSAATGNQWYKDGVALTDSIRQQLVVIEAGDYTVVVMGVNGCPSVPSDAVAITVNPTPEITLDGPANYAIAVGGTVQLPEVTTDPAGATVTWLDADGNAVSGTVGPFNTPGTYMYTVVAESGDCSATASISIVVIDPDACPPGYERIYATTVLSSSGVTAPDKATGPNLVDSANVPVPLLLFGTRDLDLGFDQSFTGEDLHVKLGTRQGVDLVGGVKVTLQPLNDGNPVGSPIELNSGWLLSLLAGTDQGDVMIPTASDLTFNGVRIQVRAALISLAGAIDVHAAYVNTKVTELAECEEVSDILTGATSGILGSVNGVDNKWAVSSDDIDDFATIRQNVNALGYVHLTTIYPSVAQAGDSVRIVMKRADGGLIDAGVLSGIWVVAYNGNTVVQETQVSGALLDLRLLAGSTDWYEGALAIDVPFDRIQIRAGGVVGALDGLDVARIQRIAQVNIVAPVPIDGIVEVCQGADLVLEGDDCGTEYDWYEELTGGTAIATGLAFTVPTDWTPGIHTVYVQPKRFGCDFGGRIPVTIMVLESPTADDVTIVADEDIYCVEDEVVLTATAVASITDPQFSWYFDADKLEPIADGDVVDGTTYALTNGVLTVTGLAAGDYTYYVSVRAGADGCENAAGDLATITITVDEEPAPALTNLEQTFCEIDGATVADLNTDGATGTVVWYTAATGGTALADDAALTAGTYYAAQVGDNCESVDRTEVTVVITETPAPVLTELEQTFCEIDGATVADLNTDGATGTVVWYTAATGGTALAGDAALAAGTYYAAQVGDDCESVDRTEVTVTITETPAPTTDNATPEFCATDNMTLADLQVEGTDIKWYASATSTDILPVTTVLEDGITYYATQMGNNCESAERLAVTPIITDCTALLSITKTADQDRVIAGESTSFTLTITNEGPGAIHSGDVIKLGERPGEGVTITGYEVTSDNGTIDGSGNAAMVTANALIPVGGIITVKVTATVDADAPETITNGIDVWGPDKDPETDPKDDEDDTPPIPVDRKSALSITKMADEARVKAGESTSFTLTITNNGPSVIEVGKEINLTERPGEGVTITGYEVTAGAATIAGNENTAVLTTTGKIAEGGTITVKVTADVSANAGETITNGITVWGPDKDPGTDPEDDEDDTPPIPVDHDAVLSITKVADEDRVTAGESTSFTLTITNEGPAVVASGEVISLTERPGEGVTITGYEVTSGNGTASGTGNSATVTASKAIAVGGTLIVKVTAIVDADAPATITNGIDVWGPDKDPETDPKDDEDDTPPIPVDRESALGITKVADESRVKAGESTSFTLTITNNGPSFIEEGKEINLAERPGEGVTITGYEVTTGAATVTGNENTAVLTTTGKIAVGGTITVKVTADVSANSGETITNGITVWGPDKDPGTDPEDDEDDTPPIPVDHDAVLSITKMADEARVKAGESTSFTLTITNEGPAIIASGAVISLTERPGEGVTITGYEVTSDNGTASGTGNSATVTTSKAIAVGGTITVKVTAEVSANAGETITNGISVWGPDKDPGTDDPDDEDDTPPIPVDHESTLSIIKTANDQSVIAGGTTSFEVTVTNNGPAVIAVGEAIAVQERPSAGLVITGYEVTSTNATIGGSGSNRQLTTTAAIAVGGTITFTVTADVTAAGGSTIFNGIAVWGPNKNPTTDDEDDEDETPEIPVERPYTLSIEKVADESLVTAGKPTTFTVTVTNNGPMAIEAGKDIALQERPGAGVTVTGYEVVSGAATVSGGGNQATITTTDAVGVNSTIVVKITANVSESAAGTITNGITVWAPDRDPDTDDPDDEDDTDPVPVDATLVIPNLFTPNGDGLNDLFVIKNLLQYQGRELTVINRWGNQVYKSNNYNNDWDGGSLAEGTYYYILRVRSNNNGEWQTYKGAVAIIRVTGR